MAVTERSHGRNGVFAIVCSALLMTSVDQTIVSTALPAIQHDLHASIGWTVWTITVYALGQVLAKPLTGRLNDRLTPRNLFLIAIAVFTASSIACGLATNIAMLIVMRFVQALGGGCVVPAGTAIVSAAFGRDRDRAIGMFTSVVPIGAMIGPIVGGLIVDVSSWRFVFLVNIPLGLAVLVAASVRLPRTTPVTLRGAPDLMGVLLVTTALGLAMVGITEFGDAHGAAAIAAITVCFVGAAGAGAALLTHIRRHENPVISPRLLVGDSFGTMNLINFCYGSTALGLAALVPLYAEERYGLPPLQAGSMLSARAVGMISVSGLTTFGLRRIGYRLPMFAGSVVIATGLLLMALPAPITSVAWLTVAAAVTGIGMGVVAPASNNAVMYLASDQVAEIVGLRGMFRQSGSITAVSIATAVAASTAEPGQTLGYVFLAFSAIVVSTLPLIGRVPDHRGSW